jgi:hypothetical protein
MKRCVRDFLTIVIILLLVADPADGIYISVKETDVPIERLIQNCEKYVDAHPRDASGHSVLARLHGLAYFIGTTQSLRVTSEGDTERLPNVVGDFTYFPYDWLKVTPVHLGEHLIRGIEHYQMALQNSERDGITRMGMAYLYEQGIDAAGEIGLPPSSQSVTEFERKKSIERRVARFLKADSPHTSLPRWVRANLETACAYLPNDTSTLDPAERKNAGLLLSALWKERALIIYRGLFEEALKGKEVYYPLGAPEVGQAIIRTASHGPLKPTPQELKEIEIVKQKTAKLPPTSQIVTPIVFSLQPNLNFFELTDSSKRVDFDLDGAHQSTWPWLAQDTYLLVWDPKHSGKITSGLQLFGSVTWWMFWENGYQPLAMLDDNGDGWLTDDELIGIAAWNDKNGNAVSDPREVVSLGELGITAINTTFETDSEGIMWQPEGLQMGDGQTLPTFDWVPVPVSTN